MKQSDLRPCPFCGHYPDTVMFDDADGVRKHYIHCPYCEAKGPRTSIDDNPGKTWNTRTTDKPIKSVSHSEAMRRYWKNRKASEIEAMHGYYKDKK
jgi:hypothetical protein